MVFGVKAHRLADGGNGVIAVFQLLNGDVDLDRVQKTDRCFAKLLAKQMIELGLTDAAALGNVANRLDPIPVVGDEFDRGL